MRGRSGRKLDGGNCGEYRTGLGDVRDDGWACLLLGIDIDLAGEDVEDHFADTDGTVGLATFHGGANCAEGAEAAPAG